MFENPFLNIVKKIRSGIHNNEHQSVNMQANYSTKASFDEEIAEEEVNDNSPIIIN